MLSDLPAISTTVDVYCASPDGGPPVPATHMDHGMHVRTTTTLANLLQTLHSLARDLMVLTYKPRPDPSVWQSNAMELHHLMVEGEMEEFGSEFLTHHPSLHWHLVHQWDVINELGRILANEAGEHCHQQDMSRIIKVCRRGSIRYATDLVTDAVVRRALAVIFGYIAADPRKHAYH